jgi:putative redox protein
MQTTPSTVFVKWIESTLMVGMDSRGKTLVIGKDSSSSPEWIGLKSSDLLLIAAAACTAYDVINILMKQREPVLGMEIICTGEQLSEPPNTFVSIELKYMIKGGVDGEKLKRAIKLSEEKYCSVLSTLRQGTTVHSSYEVIN